MAVNLRSCYRHAFSGNYSFLMTPSAAYRQDRNPVMKARQTQSYLQNLFAQRGIVPQRRFGQNFLIDLNIHAVIVRAADVTPGDVILEIGSGTGALTSLLAARGATVVAVDVDPGMARLTAEVAAGHTGVRVISRDILESKHRLDPQVLDNVRSAIAAGSGRRFKVVANLPYHVATPVIVNLLLNEELCPSLLVVTVQRELADRLCAEAASAAYGAVSVVVQALADVAVERTLPPSVFWPRPKVDSAIVSIRPNPQKRALVAKVSEFHELVRRMFLHRRKYMRHVLADIWRDHWSKADVDAWLEERGLSGQLRAETLNVEEFIALGHALAERWGAIPHTEARRRDDSPPEPEVPPNDTHESPE
jgi:16S rRNA (adenine1518-N6/adenine1519-N6)-dimethyltransferase